MASRVERKIMTALYRHMSGFVPSPSVPIVYPRSVAFSPDGPYIAVYYQPNGAIRQHISSDGIHRFIGLMQVSVFWTKGDGETAPMDMASAIADHFPADLSLIEDDVTVRITKRPDIVDPIVEDAWVQVPVSIDFEAYA